MSITPDQIHGILAAHAKWLRNEPGGIRADLRGADLRWSDLRRANLSKANMSEANLHGADLSEAHLRGVIMNEANMSEANLHGADLSEAHLRGADLRWSDLRRANLSKANLSWVSLSESHLRGAKIDGEEVISTASVSFSGHGECERHLLAISYGKNIRLWCGCFTGNANELRAYIKNGKSEYAKTRTLALKTVLMLLKAKNP